MRSEFAKKVKRRFKQTIVKDDHLFIPVDEKYYLAEDTLQKTKYKHPYNEKKK